MSLFSNKSLHLLRYTRGCWVTQYKDGSLHSDFDCLAARESVCRARFQKACGSIRMRRKVEENNLKSKGNEKNSSKKAKCDGGSKTTTKNVESESKGASSRSTEAYKATSETKSGKDITFIVLQKSARSPNSSERFDELTQKKKWKDASGVLCWSVKRGEQAMPRSARHNIFMGSGKFENKYGFGILVNSKWRKHINSTDYSSERAISTSITVNKQHVLLMSENFPHSGFADHHVEKVYRSIEKLPNSNKKNIQIVRGDFNAELGPGYGVERVSFGSHNLRRGEKERRLNEVQKNAWKASYSQDTKKVQKTVGLLIGGQETFVLQLRRWSKRHDLHGKRPQKCYGTIRDYSTKEGSPSKNAHRQEENLNSREYKEPRWRKKARSNEAIKFEERYAELEWQNKHEAEIPATTQKPRMTESSTMLEQAEGGVVAEVAAAHLLNENANAAAAGMEQAEASGRSRRCWSHSITLRCSYSEDATWKTCCGSWSSTPFEWVRKRRSHRVRACGWETCCGNHSSTPVEWWHERRTCRNRTSWEQTRCWSNSNTQSWWGRKRRSSTQPGWRCKHPSNTESG